MEDDLVVKKRDGEFEEGQADERGFREGMLVAEREDFSFDLGGKRREGREMEFGDGFDGFEGGGGFGGRGVDVERGG